MRVCNDCGGSSFYNNHSDATLPKCRVCDRRRRGQEPVPQFFVIVPRERVDHRKCVPGKRLCDECAAIMAAVLLDAREEAVAC